MEDNICYVCYESEMTETLPCSHKLCGHCYELLNKCPMCRAPYHEDEEMYHDIDDDDDYDYVDEAPFFGFLIVFFCSFPCCVMVEILFDFIYKCVSI